MSHVLLCNHDRAAAPAARARRGTPTAEAMAAPASSSTLMGSTITGLSDSTAHTFLIGRPAFHIHMACVLIPARIALEIHDRAAGGGGNHYGDENGPSGNGGKGGGGVGGYATGYCGAAGTGGRNDGQGCNAHGNGKYDGGNGGANTGSGGGGAAQSGGSGGAGGSGIVIVRYRVHESW